MDPDSQLRALAARQHGLVTLTQVTRAGLTPEQLRTRVSRGSLERLSRTVLRIGGCPPSTEQRVLAAVWASGPTAVASHTTAAWLHGFESIRTPSGKPHVLVLRPATGNRRLAVVHQALDLRARDRCSVLGIPTTSPVRTLADLGAVVGPRRLEAAVDGALRDGLVSLDQLRRALFELWRPGPSGVGRLAAVLGDDEGGRPESWLERAALGLFAAAGLPTPEVQVVIDVDGSTFRLDFVFADGAVVVEVSGHRTHSTRRQRPADAERRNRLLLRGISVWEFTYEDVIERPRFVADTVRAAIATRHPLTSA